jgi:integrase
MARPNSVRFRADRGTWVTKLDSKLVTLATGRGAKAEALKALRVLLVSRDAAKSVTCPLVALLDEFGAMLQRDHEPATAEWYARYLKPFVQSVGGYTEAMAVRPIDLERWLGGRSWGPSTRYAAVTAVKRLFRWGKKTGLLGVNPLADAERPTPRRREAIPTADQVERIYSAVLDRPFRDLLDALRETGCRPGEITRLTADGVNLDVGTWTVVNKTRHATGDPTRTIHLTEAMVELSRRLIGENPVGPLFVNRRKNAWTRNAMAWRFGRLRRKLGIGPEATAYAFRHLYATDALERGVPIATVAELMGHKSTAMVSRIYSKLRERSGHLRDAANQVRPPLAS